MFTYEWLWNHIIRATGASSTGLIDLFANQSEHIADSHTLEESIAKEKKFQILVIKRLFVLCLNFIEPKIKKLELRGKNKPLINRLKTIQEDCKNILQEFEKRGY